METQTSHIPQISIGMPVYNGERYIREALDMLLDQTFTNFELIISDNASTDGTEAICNDYADRDSRVKYFRQSTNRGAMKNFLFILNEARGAYFMWSAVDDLLGTKETLANLATALGNNFQLAIPDVDLLNETKGTISKGIFSSFFSTKRSENNFTELALKYPSFQIFGLYVTQSLRDFVFLLDSNSDLSCFVEGVFVHAVSQKLRCVFVGEALLVFRRHGTNTSSSVAPPILLKDFIIYTRRVLAFYAKTDFPLQRKIYYMAVLGFKNIKYTLRLVVSVVAYLFRKSWKVIQLG